MFGCLFFLLFGVADEVSFYWKKNFGISNHCISIGIIILILIIRWIAKKSDNFSWMDNREDIYNDKKITIIGILFFFVQLFVFYNIFFETGWDSGNSVLPATKELLTHVNPELLQESYYNVYPNNLFIINVFAVLLKLNSVLGIFNQSDELMIIIVFNCVLCGITMRLTYEIVKRLWNRKWAEIAYVFCALLLGCSPWNVICYSDQIALLFPTLLFYIHIHGEWNIRVRYFLYICLGYIGYCIKPQALIMVLAIFVYEIIKSLDKNKFRKKEITNVVTTLAVAIIFIALLSVGMKKIYKAEGFLMDENQKFGMTHFLMMGMNTETEGTFNVRDVYYSRDEASAYDERVRLNLTETKTRLKNMGVKGFSKLIAKKALIDYNDGTFAWSAEGNFYKILKENKLGSVSETLRQFYYETGKWYSVFITFEQIVWMTCLFFVFVGVVGVFSCKKRYRTDYIVALLAIIGLTIFELIFEARARYLYCYVPIYIIMMTYGMNVIKNMHFVKPKMLFKRLR